MFSFCLQHAILKCDSRFTSPQYSIVPCVWMQKRDSQPHLYLKSGSKGLLLSKRVPKRMISVALYICSFHASVSQMGFLDRSISSASTMFTVNPSFYQYLSSNLVSFMVTISSSPKANLVHKNLEVLVHLIMYFALS